jgi:hypothetical protein
MSAAIHRVTPSTHATVHRNARHGRIHDAAACFGALLEISGVEVELQVWL